MLSYPRRLIKVFHPEGIPALGTLFYNFITKTKIFQHHYDLIAEDILKYIEEGSILDVGTGPGWLLLKLHARRPNLQITGIDISPAMVRRAKENIQKAGLSSSIEVQVANAGEMPFPDNSFDCIVSTGSLHHWKEPIKCLNEIHRILKLKQYALIYDLVSDTPPSVLKEIAKKLGKLRMWLLWLHALEEPFYSCNDFKSLLQHTQFKDGEAKFVGVMYCLILRKTSL